MIEAKICARCGERKTHGKSNFCAKCMIEHEKEQKKKYRKEVLEFKKSLKTISGKRFESLVEWCETEGIREIFGRLAK